MAEAQSANKLRGVHLATVIDNKDGEGNPGFRVKVKFPVWNAWVKAISPGTSRIPAAARTSRSFITATL